MANGVVSDERHSFTAAAIAAGDLLALLRPHCVCCSVAGSVRRGKPRVKDIEIVCVPDVVRAPGELFETSSSVDVFLDEATKRGPLRWDEERPLNGPRQKRLTWELRHPGDDPEGVIGVDLFIAEAGNYGAILAIRTGPADFSHLMVTRQEFRGALPEDLRQRDGYLWLQTNAGPQRIDTPTEQGWFQLIGVPCWPPEQRSVEKLRTHLFQRKHGEV